jgi:putative hydrolase of the HAD superfamily
MTPPAVIFDLWGTLVPAAWERWRAGLAAMAEAAGLPLDRFEPAWRGAYERRLVSDLRANVDEVCRSLGVTSEEAIAEVFRLRVQMHRDTFRPREDAASTLRELRARGHKTGLVTNCSSEVPGLLKESELSGLFDVEVYSAVSGVRKPESAIYELATRGIGLDPALCLYLGDGDDRELEGARDFGMSAILLESRDTHPPDGWKGARIARLSELLALVP